RTRIRPPRCARRRPSSHRRRHRQRLRPGCRETGERMSATAGRAAVFGLDEQEHVAVDLERWTRLATAVLDDANVPAGSELTLMFVDEDRMAELNSQHMGVDGPTDVLAFPIDDELVEAGRWPDG